jgi:hypothetical protein
MGSLRVKLVKVEQMPTGVRKNDGGGRSCPACSRDRMIPTATGQARDTNSGCARRQPMQAHSF